MAHTDPFGHMQLTIDLLQKEVDQLKAQQGQHTLGTGGRSWNDVAHGISLALDIIRREIQFHQPPDQILASVERLHSFVTEGERIEYDASKNWRWLALEEKRRQDCRFCGGSGWIERDHLSNKRCACNPGSTTKTSS